MPKQAQFGVVSFEFHSELDGAASVAECISVLGSAGLGSAADRMTYLKTLLGEDADSDLLDADSARGAARFMTKYRLPADPAITASDDGIVHPSWHFVEMGDLMLEFLSSGLVIFAAILHDSDSERYSVSGTMAPDDALAAARPICENLFGS